MSQTTAEHSPVEGRQENASWQNLPLGIFPEGTDPLCPRRQTQWIWALLAVGLVARLVRYLLCFPLWEDEAMLATNYLDRGYVDLLKPLGYLQVCPPLCLWSQLTAVRLLGFTEYALRLIPFLCGIAGLFLFHHVARRLLRGTALVLAVGIFAVSYPMIRYTAEAKPYGCDLFLALAMLALLIEWLRRPHQTRWLWCLAAMIGPAVGYSYPAVFVAGGISLAAGWVLWSRGGRGWRPWLVFNLILAASFAALTALNRVAVGETTMRVLLVSWSDRFVPIAQPLELLPWFFSIHTGGMLGFPIGGPNWGSTLTFLCCAVGVAGLVRRRLWMVLFLFLSPLGLNFVAGALQRFPYGSHMRLSMYMGPIFCTLIALGIAEGLAWHAGRRRARSPDRGTAPHPAEIAAKPLSAPSWPLAAVLGALVLLAAATLLRDLSHPYKSGTTLRAREFARWFWNDLACDSEVVCLETDVRENLSPGTYDYGWSALYLCNQRIYSPRHARGEPPRWDRVSAERPLRCALYRSTSEERKSDALDRWLQRMQLRYQLVARDKYPFPIYDKRDRSSRGLDFIEVFKFVPKIPAGAEVLTESQPAGSIRR
jgi:hypothetical protein